MTDADVQFLDDVPPAHPLAELFPDLPADEADVMRGSVERAGIQNPVSLWNGNVLDGRQRAAAARGQGIPIPARTLPEDTDPIEFVIAQNFCRRQLTAGQTAMIAVLIVRWVADEIASGRSTVDHVHGSNRYTIANVAKMLGGASRGMQSYASTVSNDCTPDVVQAVVDGDVQVKDAASISHRQHAEQKALLRAARKGQFKSLVAAMRGIYPAPVTGDGLPSDAEIERRSATLMAPCGARAQAAASAPAEATPPAQESAARSAPLSRASVARAEGLAETTREERDTALEALGAANEAADEAALEIERLKAALAEVERQRNNLMHELASAAEFGTAECVAERLAYARAAVEALAPGARSFAVGSRLSLTPSVEVGVRQDGGDAETGVGLDLGGGLVLSDSVLGLSLDLRVRTLVVHQAEGFRERGMALSLDWDPTPSSPLGLRARLAPQWGGQAQSGTEALWGRGTVAGLNDAGFALGNRFSGEVGYGLPLGRRFVGTPHLGFGTSEYGRDLRLGYRMTMLETGALRFDFRLDAQRRNSPLHETPDQALLGNLTLGW